MLKAPEGCTFCLEVKPLLVWPAVVADEAEYSAQAVVTFALRTMKKRLRKIDKLIGSEKEYDASLTRDLTSAIRALKELAGEQRKLEDREEERYAALGIEGRIELYATEFFAALPTEYQVRCLELMRDCFEEQNKPKFPEPSEDPLLNE